MPREDIPKANWAAGPWHDEPDALDWRDERTGLYCAIRRTMLIGALCGYVGVPPGHAFHGWRYDDEIPSRPEDMEGTLNDKGVFNVLISALGGGHEHGTIHLGMALNVHGGITWTGEAPEGAPDGLWWFGFDCAHAGDQTPGLDAVVASLPRQRGAPAFTSSFRQGWQYRTIEYVRQECTRLAFQLRQLEQRVIEAPLPETLRQNRTD